MFDGPGAVDFARLSGPTITLDHDVAEGGGNLSAGTRQLVMLARAMLCKSRVLLLDEATSQCDYATDAVIQRVLRSHFQGATILTIAHRLETIIDYDRLLFLESGRVVEAGEPAELLANPASRLSALVADVGGEGASRLRQMADEAAERRSME